MKLSERIDIIKAKNNYKADTLTDTKEKDGNPSIHILEYTVISKSMTYGSNEVTETETVIKERWKVYNEGETNEYIEMLI